MADRFCVGPTTNTTAGWSGTSGGASGASIPVAGDNVYFDANSPNCRIDANFVCRSIDCNGYTNTLTHGAGFSISIGDATAGAGNICLRFVVGMIYTKEHPSSCSISFLTTSATQQTIYWGGKIVGDMNFNATSNGSWLFMSDCNWTDLLATMTFTKGTLNTNGFICNGGQFTSSNANVRVLTLGATVFNLTGVGNNCWLCATITNLTVTANTAVVKMYRSLQCFAPLLQSGTIAWGFILKYMGGGIQTIASGGTPTFGGMENNGGPDLGDGREDRFQQNNNWSIAAGGTWVINGYSSSRRFRVHSNGAARTVTVPNSTAVTCQYTDFNVTILSVTNDLSASVGGVGNLGGNSGIIFTTGITNYWYSTTGGVKNWADSNNWFLATGGTGGQGRKPLPQDNARFDANSVNASGTIIRCDMGSEKLGKDIDFTGCLNTPTWDFQIDTTFYGNLILIAGMAMTSYASAFINMNGNGTSSTFTLTSAGQIFPHIQFQFNMDATNTYTLADDFNAVAGCLVSFFNGIFASNSKNMTSGRFTCDTHSFTLGTSIFNATTLTGTAFNITAFATTYSCASAEFKMTGTGTGARAFAGSGTSRIHGKLTITGAGDCTYTFSGTNTFSGDFVTKGTVHTLAFTTGTITTFLATITCVGSAGNYITLRSTTTTAFTWSKASGIVNCDYLNLSKSTASGGATFNAGSNTINGGGNTGWTGLVTANFTWLGTTNSLWSIGTNWQGGSAPTNTDTALFTGVAVVNCTINVAIDIKGINIGLGYTGVITQSANATFGTDGIEQYGGTFTGGAFTIANSGRFKQVSGVWTNCSGLFSQTSQGAGADTWNTSGGTFTANGGTVEVIGTLDAVITNANTRQFFNLTYNTSGQVSGTHFADGAFTRTQGAVFNADVSIKGNYLGSLISGDVGAGTGILRLTNSAGQSLTYPKTAGLQLNATGTITLNNDIEVNGTFTHTVSVTVNGFKLILKGNISLTDTATSGTTTTEIGGTTAEQTITGAGVLVGNIVVNKSAGFIKQLSNVQPTDSAKTLTITNGQWATNNYSLTCVANLTIGASGALNKTPSSSIFYTSLSGQITSKKSTYQENVF